ncbi:hypothetical protein B9Z55_003544 [Caenorhabditis nigoni]|nr:hypothetical protein B9Z55_003544 [Caenorhabditis nigoni]
MAFMTSMKSNKSIESIDIEKGDKMASQTKDHSRFWAMVALLVLGGSFIAYVAFLVLLIHFNGLLVAH